ncbi:MAG: hypothetical protein FWD46_09050 [Cystobacterineae bacterium]|nr:hypothetical protein [Cystobacterineae bacterium]
MLLFAPTTPTAAMRLPLCLAALVLLLSGAYYAFVAFAPPWLHSPCCGLPLSILCGLALFTSGAALSLLYAFAPTPRLPPPSHPSSAAPPLTYTGESSSPAPPPQAKP